MEEESKKRHWGRSCFLTMSEICKTGIRYFLFHGDPLSYRNNLLFCLINNPFVNLFRNPDVVRNGTGLTRLNGLQWVKIQGSRPMPSNCSLFFHTLLI